MKKEMKNYVAPKVESMKARVERGFAGSGIATSQEIFAGTSSEQVGFNGALFFFRRLLSPFKIKVQRA